MKHFFEPKPNQLLYHYTSQAAAAAILQNQTFRLSEFSKMNDRSEYTYSKGQFIKAFQDRKVSIDEIPRLIISRQFSMLEPSTIMMIGCLTKESDDVGLWERYAENGAGCVIGIDANWLAERAGVRIRRVSYDPVYLQKFANSGFLMLQTYYEENPRDPAELIKLASQLIVDLYAFKDPRFRSEREVRISRLLLHEKKAPFGIRDIGAVLEDGLPLPPLSVQQANSRYGPKRFIDLPLRDAETPTAIRSVLIGPKADPAIMKTIESACANFPGIKLRRSEVPLR